ncbi:MAG: hypothetical protein Q9160_000430 [Pyrenula sp. 1 TL-2023]
MKLPIHKIRKDGARRELERGEIRRGRKRDESSATDETGASGRGAKVFGVVADRNAATSRTESATVGPARLTPENSQITHKDFSTQAATMTLTTELPSFSSPVVQTDESNHLDSSILPVPLPPAQPLDLPQELAESTGCAGNGGQQEIEEVENPFSDSFQVQNRTVEGNDGAEEQSSPLENSLETIPHLDFSSEAAELNSFPPPALYLKGSSSSLAPSSVDESSPSSATVTIDSTSDVPELFSAPALPSGSVAISTSVNQQDPSELIDRKLLQPSYELRDTVRSCPLVEPLDSPHAELELSGQEQILRGKNKDISTATSREKAIFVDDQGSELPFVDNWFGPGSCPLSEEFDATPIGSTASLPSTSSPSLDFPSSTRSSSTPHSTLLESFKPETFANPANGVEHTLNEDAKQQPAEKTSPLQGRTLVQVVDVSDHHPLTTSSPSAEGLVEDWPQDTLYHRAQFQSQLSQSNSSPPAGLSYAARISTTRRSGANNSWGLSVSFRFSDPVSTWLARKIRGVQAPKGHRESSHQDLQAVSPLAKQDEHVEMQTLADSHRPKTQARAASAGSANSRLCSEGQELSCSIS